MTRKINRIMRTFNKAVKALERLENKNNAKISGHYAAIDSHVQSIAAREQAIDEHNFEISRARSIREKIENLIS
jgi:hypothetical protein